MIRLGRLFFLAFVRNALSLSIHALRSTESSTVPTNWKQLGRANDAAVIHLNIGLVQSGLGELETRLYQGMYTCPL